MRRPLIIQRRRVFVGCEGDSEFGYVTLLAHLLEEVHRGCHIHPERLGGGDPLAMVQAAQRRLPRLVDRRGEFSARFILLDADKGDENLAKRDQAVALAKRLNVQLIWREPCHEGLLLRHLPGFGGHRPVQANTSLQALRHQWPEYEKPLNAVRLGQRVDRAAVLRAAAVEPELRAFLLAIEFGGN